MTSRRRWASTTSAPQADTSVAAVAGWHTWVLASADEIEVPAPPADGSAQRKAELAEVKELAAEATPAVEEQMKRWTGSVPTEPWTLINNEYIASQAKDPPLSSRNLAYTHAAMYDALVAAYHWKGVYERGAPNGAADNATGGGPVPSYPSEHAAMAGAASRVLAHLYPNKPARTPPAPPRGAEVAARTLARRRRR